jgi:hypothetical protein
MYSFWVFLSGCWLRAWLIGHALFLMLIAEHWANVTIVVKHYPPIALMINRHIFRAFIRMDKVSAFIRFGRVRMNVPMAIFAHVDKV